MKTVSLTFFAFLAQVTNYLTAVQIWKHIYQMEIFAQTTLIDISVYFKYKWFYC